MGCLLFRHCRICWDILYLNLPAPVRTLPWKDPTLSELQGQPQPPLPQQRSGFARIGYALAAYFLFRVVIGGVIGMRNAGHTQTDMDKHLAAWKDAGIKYSTSASMRGVSS
jgi:hypothetical protein